MVLKVYGYSALTNPRRVAVVCKELNIPYELIGVSFAKGEHKSAEYLQKQPFGQVPVIDDDGFIVYESRAICRYLAAKSGSPLLPKQSDLQSWTKFEIACSVETANFEVPSSEIIFEKIIKPSAVFLERTPDEDVVKKMAETLETKFVAYEAILSKQKYLGGNEITLADIFHLPNGSDLEKLGFDFFNSPNKPNVARWWKDISSRPSWQSVREGA